MTKVQALSQQLKASRVGRSLADAVKELRAALPVKTSVVMFHTGRCGSTVLAKMLNEHSDIRWAGEIFERMPERYKDIASRPDAARVIVEQSRRECRLRGKRTYGFELKYLPGQHLRDGFVEMSLDECVAFFRGLNFSKFIVLNRENYLRRAISAEVLRQNRSGHTRSTPTRPTRVHLDVRSFDLTSNVVIPLLDSFRFIDEQYAHLKELLSKDDVLYLSYEKDVLDDPSVAYRRICTFLAVAPESPQVPLARTNPFACEDMIENVDEVRAVLQHTRYEWMLD